MVFETLNRLKWKDGLENCKVRIIHRGSPGNVREINGSDIEELKKSYFTYQKDGRESTIPLHRVIGIEKDGDVIWKRKTKKG